MRFFSFMLILATALVANAQNYTIKGKALAASNGKTLYLIDQNTLGKVDSCVVDNGGFLFKGNADDQKLFLLINPENSVRSKVYIFVQPGIDITVDLTSAHNTVSDNGGMNDALAVIENEVATKGNILNERIRVLLAEGKTEEEITAILKADVDSVFDIYHQAIEDNKDNMLGAYIATMISPRFYTSLAELDSIIAKVKYAKDIAYMRRFRDEYSQKEGADLGVMYKDFSGFTLDGAPSKLSDYVGKGRYVLVDFWASWCGPCKREIPNLLELQNKFGGDKFTVLGVNVWDTEEKFKAALVSEGINYPQIYVPRNNKDNATEIYGIKGIPQIILFAPDGTIVRRDLRGDAMKALVEEKMK